jgi:hypothetical protein
LCGSPPWRNGNAALDNVITQLPDGSLDAIGFVRQFLRQDCDSVRKLLASGKLRQSDHGAVNQDVGGVYDQNLQDAAGHEGVQVVSQLASGQFDILSFDSGYNDVANEGVFYASDLLSTSFPGWHAVDAGVVAHSNNLFPVV